MIICKVCDGNKEYEGHHPLCNGEECLIYGCPVILVCENCNGLGLVKEEDYK